MPPADRRGLRGDRRLDLVGVALVVAAGAWTLASAGSNPGSRPLPTLAALAGVTFAVVAGRLLRRDRQVEPLRAVLALAGPAVLLLAGASATSWTGTGYANADATAAGLVALAGALVARTAGTRAGSAAGLVGSVAGVGAAAAIGSVGATASTLVALAVVAASGPGRRRAAVAAAVAIVLAGTAVVVGFALGAGPAAPARDSFGVRVLLWREAVELVRDDPVHGVGPGRFQEEQAVSGDDDLRRTHSLPLQVAAEQGVPGTVLLAALAGWTVAVASRRRADPGAVVAAAAIVLLGLEGSFDWVVAEPAVSLGAALLVGAATRRPEPGSRG